MDTVDEQLSHQASVETRNRKPMRPNPIALWELRIGDLRVYYDIEEEPETVVNIRAVGIKERNQVRIGREVIEKQNATGSLAEYSSNIANEPVIVTSNGKPIAVLVSIENTDIETVSLSNNQKFLDLIERSRSRHRAAGGISSEEMRRRLGLGESKKA